MDSSQDAFAAYQEILEAHRALKELLEQIEQALERRTATMGEVSSLLARLGDDLVKHFALEERGGYFSDALLHAPQLLAKANELLAQHPMMSTRAGSLVEDLKPLTESDQWWQQTRQRFHAFKAELLRHESQENQLLLDAYNQDIGSHD